MKGWVRVLTIAGWVLGAAVILYGLGRFVSETSIPALLVSPAVLVAGPLEDILKTLVRRTRRVEEEPAIKIVDLTISVAFLILALFIVYLLP